MPVTPGTRLGVFEIVGPLGAGGMGEVYRARDTRLGRSVALKILPPLFAADPDRLSRFEREAKTLAALNHPNIAQIYGIETSGEIRALAMELVEGEDLSERLARGALPLDEALPIARQIADALEAAHELGIVHRDLKPANVKVRHDGTVKVLDFGLAKALVAEDPSGTAGAMHSPTFTSPAMTEAGVILGTAVYMAPEQARGRAVDRRADIWAFGVVLFEMLTGRRPFGGETTSDILAAILRDAPAFESLPTALPAALRDLLRRTLEKDPRRRLRDIGDARLALEDLQADPPAVVQPASTPARGRWRVVLPWALALLMALVAGATLRTRSAPAIDTPLVKYTLPIGGDPLDRNTLPILSPDGRRLAFVKDGTLWIRELQELEPRQLAGTSGAQYPLWSPDSRQVAYLTTTAIWRVGAGGGQPALIASYHFSKGSRTPGGVWRADDTIVFAPAATGSGLLSVPAQGGEFTELHKQDPKTEGDYHRPSLLPDGRSLLFVVDRLGTGADTLGVLANGVRKDVLTLKGERLDSPVYSPTGHLLYQRETTTPGIWAVPFAVDRLEVTGAPFIVAPQGSWPGVGSNGVLIYADNELSGLRQLAWLDLQTAQATPALAETFGALSAPRVSPDGRRVTAIAGSPDLGSFVIVADLQRQTHVRLGERADQWSRPAWRDDRTVVYSHNVGGKDLIVARQADGSGKEAVVCQGIQPHVAAGRLVFVRLAPGVGGGLWQVLLPPGSAAAGEPSLLQQLAPHEWDPALSPDGQLLAYTRGEASEPEVMLRRFPEDGDQWQVSTTGGRYPVWSPRGDTLYFKNVPGEIFAVEVRRSPQVSLSPPRPIARPPSLVAMVGFDASPDGNRLLMVQEVKTATTGRPLALTVVQNWFAEFRK